MVAPVRADETSPTQVQVTWQAMSSDAETGGLAILSYELEYDKSSGDTPGTGNWQTLVGYPSDSLLTEYMVSGDAIVTGTGEAYQFRVRAKNALGWGNWSPIGVVAASAAPGQMSPVATEIDPNDAVRVLISWTAPATNYDAILEYEVLVRESDGVTFTEETTACDGAGTQQADMLADRECSIEL